MDSFFEKFSVYDFFNLLIGGGFFLVGLHIIGLPVIAFLFDNIGLPNNNVIEIAILLGVCYIIGIVLQDLGLWIEEKKIKSQSSMTSTFLRSDSNIIKNSNKLRIYQNKAKRLFRQKQIAIDTIEFTDEQCEYFFAYCIYYIQVRNQNKKTEKMRGLKGFATMVMVCFAILAFIGLVKTIYLIFSDVRSSELLSPFLATMVFIILAVENFFRMKRVTLYWIRMVLGVYETCSDIDQWIGDDVE